MVSVVQHKYQQLHGIQTNHIYPTAKCWLPGNNQSEWSNTTEQRYCHNELSTSTSNKLRLVAKDASIILSATASGVLIQCGQQQKRKRHR
jgi:hypothetical protein